MTPPSFLTHSTYTLSNINLLVNKTCYIKSTNIYFELVIIKPIDKYKKNVKIVKFCDFPTMNVGTTLTNQNSIQEEIKSRLNSWNVSYHSLQNLLSSSLLSKNLKINIYRTIILPVVLYGCETWSLTLREEHRLRMFENRVLRRIFGPTRDEVTGEWRKLHN